MDLPHYHLYTLAVWPISLTYCCFDHLDNCPGAPERDPPPAVRLHRPPRRGRRVRPMRRHGGVGRRRRSRRGPVSARDPISAWEFRWSLWPDAATGLPCPDYCTAALQEMKHLVTVGGDAASRWRGVGLFPPPLKVKPIDIGEQRPVFCSSCSVVVCMHMSLFGC